MLRVPEPAAMRDVPSAMVMILVAPFPNALLTEAIIPPSEIVVLPRN